MTCARPTCPNIFDPTEANPHPYARPQPTRRYCSRRCKDAVKDIRRREERRALLIREKSKPCADCGGTFPTIVMDFHHLDPSTKAFGLADGDWQSLKATRAEIAKCSVLCANCHRLRTLSLELTLGELGILLEDGER